VVELGGQAGSRLRCGFCFHPVQSMPPLTDETPMNAPPVILSDAWIGDSVVRPFFRSSVAPESTGRSTHTPRRSRATSQRAAAVSVPRR
jgi:hypothetical protein